MLKFQVESILLSFLCRSIDKPFIEQDELEARNKSWEWPEWPVFPAHFLPSNEHLFLRRKSSLSYREVVCHGGQRPLFFVLFNNKREHFMEQLKQFFFKIPFLATQCETCGCDFRLHKIQRLLAGSQRHSFQWNDLLQNLSPTPGLDNSFWQCTGLVYPRSLVEILF